MTLNRLKQIRYFLEKDQPYFGGPAPTLTELWEYILQLQDKNEELRHENTNLRDQSRSIT